MCDSLTISTSPPPSRLTARRVPRVWRFAIAADVAAKNLEAKTREWMAFHWADCWGKEVGEVGKRERDGLVKDVVGAIRPKNVVSSMRGILAVRTRTESEFRSTGQVATRGSKQNAWMDNLLGMLLEVEVKARSVLLNHFGAVVDGKEFGPVLEMTGFERELLEKILDDVVAATASPDGCKEAGRVYEVSVISFVIFET
jgi:hypothetical protein